MGCVIYHYSIIYTKDLLSYRGFRDEQSGDHSDTFLLFTITMF